MPRCGWVLLLLLPLMLTAAGCGRPSDAALAGVLPARAVSARGRERVEATEAALDLAERLADAGDAETAERIYSTLWEASDTPDRRHVRCAAIRGLARVLGRAAVEEVAWAMAGEDDQVAAAVFAAAVETGGEDVTRAWADYLPSAPAAVQPEIVHVVGRRGGPVAAEAVLAAVDSEDDAVRRAAIESAGRLATPRAVGPLLGLLDSADAGERAAAETALARLSAPGVSEAVAEYLARQQYLPDGAAGAATRRASALIRILVARAARDQTDAVAGCLADGPPEVQTAALEALAVLGGERHVPAILAALVQAKHDDVRRPTETALAAIGARASRGGSEPVPSDAEGHPPREEAPVAASAAGAATRRASVGARLFAAQVVGGMEGAGPEARAALVRVLGAVPTEEGLAAVRDALRSDEAAVRLTAVRVVSDWPTAAPAPDLLAVAHEAASAKARILAVRGVVRLSGRVAEPAARTRLLGRALAAAERVQEKRLALAALADVASLEALRVALAHLEDASLAGEAAAATVGVAEGIAETHPEEARAALKTVLEATEAPRLRERADRLLGRLGGP